MASESEYNRLNEELNNIKKDIKDVYGVEIEEFASAINIMKEKYTSTLNELEILVSEAEEKIGNK